MHASGKIHGPRSEPEGCTLAGTRDRWEDREGFFGTHDDRNKPTRVCRQSAKEKRREGQGVNVPEHFRNYGK